MHGAARHFTAQGAHIISAQLAQLVLQQTAGVQVEFSMTIYALLQALRQAVTFVCQCCRMLEEQQQTELGLIQGTCAHTSDAVQLKAAQAARAKAGHTGASDG